MLCFNQPVVQEVVSIAAHNLYESVAFGCVPLDENAVKSFSGHSWYTFLDVNGAEKESRAGSGKKTLYPHASMEAGPEKGVTGRANHHSHARCGRAG